MDSFLTALYFEKFKNTEKHRKFKGTHNLKDSGETIRNDERIFQCQLMDDLLNSLINRYIAKIKEGD